MTLPSAPDITTLASIETEAALLGALLIPTGNQVERLADRLKPHHFYEPLHARIYSAILREHSLGRPVTAVTVAPYLAADEAFKELGGPGFLAKLTGNGAVMIGAMDFADQVIDLAHKRFLVGRILDVAASAEDYEVEATAMAAELEGALSEVLDNEGNDTAISAGDAIIELYEGLDEPDDGVTSGVVRSLDEALGKIRPGDLVILAGRPGMGKTTLGQSYMLGAAQGGYGGLFISLEMGKRQLAGKFACDYLSQTASRIPYQSIVKRSLAANQRQALASAGLDIKELPLVIEDLSGATIGKVARMVRRHKRQFKAKGQSLDLVIVDYLQLLDSDGRNEDLRTSVTKISRGLKSIAKANGVGIIAISQLNRKAEERTDKRPHVSDLRESGQIEQDADAIILLLRMEKYLRQEQPDEGTAAWQTWRDQMDRHEGQIEFIIAKNRFGEECSAFGQWYGAFQAVRG